MYLGGDWEVQARYMRGTSQVQATPKRYMSKMSGLLELNGFSPYRWPTG